MISEKFQKEIKTTLIIRDTTQTQLAESFGVDRKRLNKVINGTLEDRYIEKMLFKYLSKERVIIVGFNDNAVRRRILLPLKRLFSRKRKRQR